MAVVFHTYGDGSPPPAGIQVRTYRSQAEDTVGGYGSQDTVSGQLAALGYNMAPRRSFASPTTAAYEEIRNPLDNPHFNFAQFQTDMRGAKPREDIRYEDYIIG
ncbi:MAG: hypothetical protein AB7G06_03485 [Bdellovibrionales bacterium]